MESRSAVVCVFLLAIAAVSATNVNQCEGRSIENLTSQVQLHPCSKLPCKLKKGTNEEISIEFTPGDVIKNLKNRVQAEVYGVPLPFIGVDNQSVCSKLYTKSGEKVDCPLQAGTTYVYKDSFPILSFYPNINVKVKWALHDANKDVVCFTVPAKITG